MIATLLYLLLMVGLVIILGFILLIIIREGVKSWKFIFRKRRL
ncbi:hypothetical protein A33Q_1686 [Indibacter alkaliphilus LW1]|uniref:Uncharacterized protein n=1 Tax=Indibacter alkaliphilus (strain CCUG 57479 / KCTC 22604 / LW1) TaxID=1189612 RepID=S2E612_INDAL|nr:hypothetical protein A33Q_1686 [Indibacter alkaliphilus LW1]